MLNSLNIILFGQDIIPDHLLHGIYYAFPLCEIFVYFVVNGFILFHKLHTGKEHPEIIKFKLLIQ